MENQILDFINKSSFQDIFSVLQKSEDNVLFGMTEMIVFILKGRHCIEQCPEHFIKH